MSPYDKSSVGLCGRRPIARLGKAKRRRNRTRLLCCEPLEARQLLASTAAFTETMAATAVKPWTGTGAENAWTVTGSYFEQRTGSNYGTGNACGLEYKGGAALNELTGAMLATTNAINAKSGSGSVEFWVQSLGLDGTDGWTFQLDAGSGYVTRLSELTGSNHGWQQYHYDLAAGELVSTLKMRFQFTGGGAGEDDRIDLDQITVTVGDTNSGGMNIEVTLSDEAQGTTIAFDGLAFLTGSLGADSFFPPGKVADFWGFQYLRDNDPSQMGHSGNFLTKAANNVLVHPDSQPT